MPYQSPTDGRTFRSRVRSRFSVKRAIAIVVSTAFAATGLTGATINARAQTASCTHFDLNAITFDPVKQVDLPSDPVLGFRYVVTPNDVGHPKAPNPSVGGSFWPTAPQGSMHPGLKPLQSTETTIIASGRDADGNGTEPLCLMPGKYLVTLQDDPGPGNDPGHKVWGALFTVVTGGIYGPHDASAPAAPNSSLTVSMVAFPLKLGKLVGYAFQDTNPTNGAPDQPQELPLRGFNMEIHDYTDTQVTQDYWGNPLCTTYWVPAAPNVALHADSTAGQVNAGTHVYMLTGNVSGTEYPAGSTSATLTNDPTHTSNDVTVPALVGPFTSYNIYRTRAGVTSPLNAQWFLVASDVAPGGYQDTTADAALGGNPVVGAPGPVRNVGGECVTGADGVAVVPNLAPGKYEIYMNPPVGSSWQQTTTYAGGRAIDEAGVVENDAGTGVPLESLIEPIVQPTSYWFGFVQPGVLRTNGTYNPNLNATILAAPGTPTSGLRKRVVGCVRNWAGFPPFDNAVIDKREPIHNGWIALNNMDYAAEATATYIAPLINDPSNLDCPEGFINIPNVPPGNYQAFLVDEQLSYVFRIYSFQVDSVSASTEPQVTLEGDDAVDANGNGKIDCPRPAVVGQIQFPRPAGTECTGNVGIFRFYGFLGGSVFTDTGVAEDGTFINNVGESSIGAASASLTNDATHTANDVPVPALSGDIVSYNIYRTRANVTPTTNADWLLVESGVNPGSYTDTKPDSALGANPPAGQAAGPGAPAVALNADNTINQLDAGDHVYALTANHDTQSVDPLVDPTAASSHPAGPTSGNGVLDCYDPAHVTTDPITGNQSAPWTPDGLNAPAPTANATDLMAAGLPKDPAHCESRIADSGMDQRNPDGTIIQFASTDASGHYEFPTAVSELNKFNIAEVGFTNFETTGPSLHNEFDWSKVKKLFSIAGGNLLMSQDTVEGHRTFMDWGKRPYAPKTPGLIVGIVHYDSTRNETDARLQLPENYEPGIPDVRINLWTLGPDGLPNNYDTVGSVDQGPAHCVKSASPPPGVSGACDDVLVNVYSGTDHWQHPNGVNPGPDGILGTADDVQNVDPNGSCTVLNGKGQTPENAGDPNFLPPNPDVRKICGEVPLVGSVTKDGAFDGGWAFGTFCPPSTALPADPTVSYNDATGACMDGSDPVPMTAQSYTTETVVPHGYTVSAEENVNVFHGDQFQPQIPPPACDGPMHLVHVVDNYADAHYDAFHPYNGNDPAQTGVYNPSFMSVYPGGVTPFEGKHMPLCNDRLDVLKNGQNVNSDTFVFPDSAANTPNSTAPDQHRGNDGTGIQLPARWFGWVSDDINFDTDPTSIFYGEPRPIPNIPVTIRDFSGRQFTTVSTDEFGFYEALLPSTSSENCPIPQGICPAEYLVTIDDPGDPPGQGFGPNANFNPNYLVSPLAFEAWPGVLTRLDTPLDPVSGVTCPGSTAPDFYTVNTVAMRRAGSNWAWTPTDASGNPSGPQTSNITIRGLNFGASLFNNGAAGRVSLVNNRTGDTVDILPGTSSETSIGATSGVVNNNSSNRSTNVTVPALSGNIVSYNVYRTKTGVTTPTNAQWFRVASGVAPGNYHDISPDSALVANPPLGGIAGPAAPAATRANDTNTTHITTGNHVYALTANHSNNYLVWNDTQITFVVPGNLPAGPYQMLVTTAPPTAAPDAVIAPDLQLTSPIGITLHLLSSTDVGGSTYDPPVTYVDGNNPNALDTNAGTTQNAPFKTIQAAIDAAPLAIGSDVGALIIVKPATYRENVIFDRRVRLQGYGPGGINGTQVLLNEPDDPRRHLLGTTIDGRFWGYPTIKAAWAARLASSAGIIGHPGNDPLVPGGADVTVASDTNRMQPAVDAAANRARIDGFTFMGAQGEAGGAIFANGYARMLQISNNFFDGNQGLYGGGVVLGMPYRGDSSSPNSKFNASNQNTDVTITQNRFIGNGGIKLAGAIGLYNGADGYAVTNNNLCTNFSAEYGAGLSQFGYSAGGAAGMNTVSNNTFLFNDAVDEGGGMMVAAQLQNPDQTRPRGTGPNCVAGKNSTPPPNPVACTPAPINITGNRFSSNQSGDDGGGIRILDSYQQEINITNNFITNNNATHFGGGIALDDALNVRMVNDTIAKNTDTWSCGQTGCGSLTELNRGVGAGLASEPNSPEAQAMLPAGSPHFANPYLLNDLFYQNEVFAPGFDATGLPVLNSQGFSDMAMVGLPTAERYHPRHSTIDSTSVPTPNNTWFSTSCTNSAQTSPCNRVLDATADPFVQNYTSSFDFGVAFGGGFVVNLVGPFGAEPVPPGDLGNPGDYHLCLPFLPVGTGCTSELVIDRGASSFGFGQGQGFFNSATLGNFAVNIKAPANDIDTPAGVFGSPPMPGFTVRTCQFCAQVTPLPVVISEANWTTVGPNAIRPDIGADETTLVPYPATYVGPFGGPA